MFQKMRNLSTKSAISQKRKVVKKTYDVKKMIIRPFRIFHVNLVFLEKKKLCIFWDFIFLYDHSFVFLKLCYIGLQFASLALGLRTSVGTGLRQRHISQSQITVLVIPKSDHIPNRKTKNRTKKTLDVKNDYQTIPHLC